MSVPVCIFIASSLPLTSNTNVYTQAKTIDLCNNPLHKEPKLDMARRVINGPLFNESWVELDEEVAQVEESVVRALG